MPDTPTPECFFCGKPIVGVVSKHHRKPKRYYPRGVDHRKDNIVPSHVECHRLYHLELDNSRWSWQRFQEEMEPLHFGEGVFAD